MKKTITKILPCLLIVLTIVALPTAGRAQTSVLDDLAKLRMRLAEAERVVAAFPNAAAAALLREAQQHHRQAVQFLANRMPEAASREIDEGIKLAEEAIRIAIESALQRIRTQLQERMRRADHEVIGSGYALAEQLLQQAKKTQAEAERLLRERRYLIAVEKFKQALQQVEQALRVVHGHRLNTAPAAADNERKQFENLATRAREAVEASRNAAAKAIYEQAVKQGRSAEISVRNGRPVIARRLYYGATRLLLRAIDLANAGGANVNNRLESELALLLDLIHSLERQLEGQSDSRAAMLIGRAKLLLNEAREALERKNEQEAAWRLNLARSLVSRAMRSEPGGAKALEPRLEEELAQLNEDIKEIEQRAREQRNEDAVDLLALARQAAGKAERALAVGRQRLALQALLAAQRFLTNAETMLSKGASQEIDRNEVSQKIDRLNASLQEVSQSAEVSKNEMAMELVRQIMEIRDRAQGAFNRGRLRVANESVAVATEMLQSALRMSTAEDKGRQD